MGPVEVIDSHTAGEPTRVILSGGPNLGHGPLSERLKIFRAKYDGFRQATILEPRGSNAMVGALLCTPTDTRCATGVIFYNNTGYLGMCGHGAIGVAVTLAHLNRVTTGSILIETPVGIVAATLISRNEVAIENVVSYRYRENVSVSVEGIDSICGDIAWGGNWFFLVNGTPAPIKLENERELTDAALRIMKALADSGITGKHDAPIDHVEFFDTATQASSDSRNFVLCPGGEYDRSPCGTGTSAKIACLAASGRLQVGEDWVQESIIGSQFTANFRRSNDGDIIPTIRGRAYISAEARLVFHREDPFQNGIV